MALALPETPYLTTFEPHLLKWGQRLTPQIGSEVQDVRRLGSRYGVQVNLPELQHELAKDWLATRLQAEAENQSLTLKWPQPVPAHGFGSPQVDGADQLGTLLNVKGLGAATGVPRLTFFSFHNGVRNYLHAVTVAATANGTGHATLHISPMLRVSPADGLDLEFAEPVIEGLIEGSDIPWKLSILETYGTSFVLAENG